MRSVIMKAYCRAMIFGHRLGCHQRADRSFFWHGLKFPVCARCTGVLIGYIIAIPLYILFGSNRTLCIAGIGIMGIDWFVQYLHIRESTNVRRLFTGICAGYGIMTIQISLILSLCERISFLQI